ncbi:family 1 glycosylhydrolase [Rhodococcus ruber]|uniref:Putative beta-glucosidase n=1 Tax=Rhodococcus ruber TaxID=1830 RepID=A0A098BMM1_9NOCA|nr:family 1 glycosylhydrolase [Rhodococcus ruber]AXY52626.1 glycoside hydrolase family 1 [Rhodococcus ruber]MCD2127165.1 family 1 glycosylhydrolase [Rhodococcus ruber]MCZ4503237.1 family 1 glycosylhydrolase [Rhodococcus ruber]MCZ4530668.1 family 1 glycosylhydrolase [Rhodococcus ruber]MCZ4621632.1 family 1 glycosylhydrolase [Rhodococcus ruber]
MRISATAVRAAAVAVASRAAVAVVLAVVVATPAAAGPAPPAHAPADGFLWGVSSSGFQSEGSPPDSNWTRYAAAGRTREPVGTSVDFRHRYREDIAAAAGLGVDVFRFSVEWSRIQPTPHDWDETELRYYDDVVAAVRGHGMIPMITLDHWVYPGWIADRGGWRDPATIEAWLANAERVVARYAGQGVMWVTINEPTIYVQKELAFGGLTAGDVPRMFDALVVAHRAVYARIHELDPGARVTSNTAYIPGVQTGLDTLFVDRVRDTLDFLGLDYYYGATVDNPSAIHALTDDFASIVPHPDGMYEALMHYTHRYPGLPLYVVENGMPTADGAPRADGWTRARHLREHVDRVRRAAADGAPVFGYNYWSITDNYEWGSYTPRFGLYTVDVRTDPDLMRRPTDGVAAYRAVTGEPWPVPVPAPVPR